MRAVVMMTWCCAGGQKHCMLAPSLSSGLTSRHHVPWSAILWGQMSSTLWLCLFLPGRSFLSSEEWVLDVTRNWWCAKRPYSSLAPGVTWMNTTFWPVIFFLDRVDMWPHCHPLEHTSLTPWWFPGGYQGYSYLGRWSSGIYRLLYR